jgi:hypothetical protein
MYTGAHVASRMGAAERPCIVAIGWSGAKRFAYADADSNSYTHTDSQTIANSNSYT